MTTKPKAKAVKVQPVEASPAKPAKAPHSRKAMYSEEVGATLCRRLAEGETLTSICRADATMPKPSTVIGWALDSQHPFFEQYARARLIGYHSMADEFIDIGDHAREEAAAVAKARLRADSRKWLLSKALPKIYGDKLELDTPQDGGIAKAAAVTSAMIAALVARNK